MKRIQKLLACILAFAFSLTFVSSWPGSASADENYPTANRYNVVLVMDKSGSLCNTEGVGTDPDGLRYDAMRLFLGLLTETGNNVGVIAFDETIRYDSGLLAVDGMEDKKALVSTAESLGTSYDTDIGGAVLRATDLLTGMKEQNGMPCVILLLTDGMTDFSTESNSHVLKERSRAAARQALDKAQEEGITIYGVLLNVEGRAINGEEELRFYTDGTKGEIETVSHPEDLTTTFGRFYSIINRTEYNGAHKLVFPVQSDVETSFVVPGFGTEEVNIVIERDCTDGAPETIRVADPNGDEYDLTDHMLETSRFLLVKIPDPMPGKWDITLSGNPGDSIDVCMIYNASLSVALESTPVEGSENLKRLRFHALVTDTGTELTEDRLRAIPCALSVEDVSAGETTRYPMDVVSGGYELQLELENGREYAISAIVDLTDFEVRSNTLYTKIELPLPVAKQSAVSDFTSVGSMNGNIWELPLQSLFEDSKGTALRYSLSDDLGGAAVIEDGVLRVNLDAVGDNDSIAVIATE